MVMLVLGMVHQKTHTHTFRNKTSLSALHEVEFMMMVFRRFMELRWMYFSLI